MLEEQKYELQKQVANQKPIDGSWSSHNVIHMRPFVGSHEEEALLNEMEVTGQAFEDMQVIYFSFKSMHRVFKIYLFVRSKIRD